MAWGAWLKAGGAIAWSSGEAGTTVTPPFRSFWPAVFVTEVQCPVGAGAACSATAPRMSSFWPTTRTVGSDAPAAWLPVVLVRVFASHVADIAECTGQTASMAERKMIGGGIKMNRQTGATAGSLSPWSTELQVLLLELLLLEELLLEVLPRYHVTA